MIYQDIRTYYLSGAKNQRMVKYELIRLQGDDYLVKVFDEQTQGIADPKHIVQIDEFKITRAGYQEEHHSSGAQSELANSFEWYVQSCCQDHRNKLD
ncbi:hypothetical protein [Vagococcus sp. WN89Y]|uniref:hypothetical protein n=1 Tax=Vagococcus sp. WN89Y TaxID=3457258 RepID=UPI003FCE2EB4